MSSEWEVDSTKRKLHLTGGDHGLDAQVLRHLNRDLGGLQCQLSSRHNNHALKIQFTYNMIFWRRGWWKWSKIDSRSWIISCGSFHLDDVLGGVDLLKAGNSVRSSLSGSVLCSCQYVPDFRCQGEIRTRYFWAHRPERAIGMLASWIGLGFSHPFSKIPYKVILIPELFK